VLGRLLTPLRLATAGLVLLVAVIAILLSRGSDDYLEIPDEPHPLAGLVRVPGGKTANDGGGIYYVDVLVKRASLLESLLPTFRPEGSELIPREALFGRCSSITDNEHFELERADMRVSQVKASAVALRALGYRVRVRLSGVRVVAVSSDSHAAGVLETGDVIVSADGKPVRTRLELRAILARHSVGDTVRLGIQRGDERRTVTIRTTRDRCEPKHPIIGVIPAQALDVRFPFRIHFDLRGVGGPSAGLAFALELLEKRGRDVDHGYKVAATGEIQLDGTVTRIGGVKQKTIGARQSHVDVFLVPADGDNAREAKRYAHGLRIVPVESFQQALQALATLPPKA
jgi:PDZ domain-containing protein